MPVWFKQYAEWFEDWLINGVRPSYRTKHKIIFTLPNSFLNVFKGHSDLPVHFLDDTNKQEGDVIMVEVL